MMPMFDVQAFILVGGASSRMGQDKSQLRFGNRTGVDIIASTVRPFTQSVATVGGRQSPSHDLPNIPDLRENWGPLAGLEAAFREAKAAHALIVACDFPLVTAPLFERLLQLIGDADAAIPLQPDDRPQPLCALYRVAGCRTATEAAITAGQHSPRALIDRVRPRYVPFSEFAGLTGAEYFFFNVNTPDNYQQAQQIFTQLN